MAKNICFQHSIEKKSLDISSILFIDGRYDVLRQKWYEFCICEFNSLTKTRLTILVEKPGDSDYNILNELMSCITKYKTIYDIKTIYLCPHIQKLSRYLPKNVDFTSFFDPNLNWELYVESIIPNSQEILKLDWSTSFQTLAFCIGSIIISNQYQFI
jgi:hypothetical protein